ncbi:MAG: SusD/RagB family nutrient-binding outer membrane lipoprotein [Cytophagaceae bacterium]|nr:SusD/RagB family nutrient-binding outer membrane lipoprotein [Cytophagaceae bacterium]|tara:strand:- start:1593 stop:3044 length:1452 start_codon:yes stop_codon:yes gene_type:complete
MIKKIFLIGLGLVLAQCSNDLEELNVNEKAFTDVPAETLMSNGQRELADQLVNTNVNRNVFRLFAQQWSEATYTDEARYNILTRSIPESHWNIIYRDVLKDFDESYKRIEAEEIVEVTPEQFATDTAVKTNKLAIIQIQQTLAWSILVDTFGDIPFTDALDIDNINPTYTDDEEIYMTIIDNLESALDMLDASYDSFGGQDLYYQGDVSSWITFGNSLKLRLGMHLADVNPTKAEQMVSEAASDVILTNAQNATISYFSTTPNTNPLWVDLVQSNRRDFVPADTFVTALNDLEDPRRPVFFQDPVDGEFLGAPYGSTVTYDNYSHIGALFFTPDLEGVIFDAAETNFLLAEAVERNFIAGSAEDYYDAAITANMEYWGVSNADTAAYLAQADVAYSTAAGDFKQKIGVQKWIALYNRGFEAWTEFRRLDYPQLEAPVQSAFDAVPKRFTYPVIEQNLNNSGYSAAASAIGGDELSTPVFWDVD